MHNILCPFTLFAGVMAANADCNANVPNINKKPNIIFILADDLGFSELGCYGNKFNETPHIDWLASQGVRFTNAYSSAPVSSPYRASLMTGQYPARIGITDYLRPDAGHFLDTNYVTISEALRDIGYHTGIIGKWHLSGYSLNKAPIEVLPFRHGFDETMSSETAGIANGTYFHPYHFNPGLEKKLVTEKEYLVDRMNMEAVDFIDRNQQSPFFLYLSHYAVHTMLHGKPEIVDHFRKKDGSGTGPASKDNPDADHYKKGPPDYLSKPNNPHLAAMLKSIDEGVGMIIDKLAELGIAENTIIIFTSDNGGETRVTTNTPLRDGKSTLYEGGIREPLIVYQPQKIANGRVLNTITANFDLYPTICDLTGAALPEKQFIDGISLVPVLTGENPGENKIRTLFWHYPLESRHFLGGRSSGAVRKGDWKLIEFFDTGETELYNLEQDTGETSNLIIQFPGKAEDLRKELEGWRNSVLNIPFKN